MSSVDAELLRLDKARVRPSILVMAQFHVTGPRSFPLNFFVGAEWLVTKRRFA